MFFPKFSVLCSRAAACCLAAWMLPGAARAQDRLFFKDNHVQEGRVTGMNGNSVIINLNAASGAPGQIGFDLSLLTRVEAAPPASLPAGEAAYADGEWDKALAIFKPIADQFRGLPTDWARHAAAVLGDIYVEKHDLVRAESAYNDYRKLYPGANPLPFNLGQARIALARNNPAAARQQLDPITRSALKNPAEVSRADGAAYGQAFFLLGQLQEKEGNAPAALEDYLRTVTLFYQDRAAATRAQHGADTLRAAHKDLTAP